MALDGLWDVDVFVIKQPLHLGWRSSFKKQGRGLEHTHTLQYVYIMDE